MIQQDCFWDFLKSFSRILAGVISGVLKSLIGIFFQVNHLGLPEFCVVFLWEFFLLFCAESLIFNTS